MDIKNIDHGVELFRSSTDAVLLDVRNENEYAAGHIPGSINIPLSQIPMAEDTLLDKDQPLFVYCLSGGRSRRAVMALESMGYTKAVNLGGISAYTGEKEY